MYGIINVKNMCPDMEVKNDETVLRNKIYKYHFTNKQHIINIFDKSKYL